MLCKCIFIFAHQHVVPPTSDIARNPRKCGESCAKASRKLRYLNQALLSQTATFGSGRWIKSHVFNVRPLMKGCDSFIVKWQGPPRKLAKEVFVKFILAKEKMRSRKSGERFWRKTMWLEQNHTRFSTQLISSNSNRSNKSDNMVTSEKTEWVSVTPCTFEDRTVIHLLESCPSPSRPFCLEKFLRVQVPLGCVKTAFVTQGLGSREFVKNFCVLRSTCMQDKCHTF